jgi:hypothetical protein
MVLEGTIVKEQIVLDHPQPLPEGARVHVEIRKEPTLAFMLKYAGKAKHLPNDMAEKRDRYLHGKPSS